MLDAPLPESGPWPLVGIRDEELAQVAWNLERGALVPLGRPNSASVGIAIAPTGQIAGRGPYHADIYWNQPDGTPRGPFELIKPAIQPCTYVSDALGTRCQARESARCQSRIGRSDKGSVGESDAG